MNVIAARFWAKVCRTGDDDCWEWLAGFFNSGYGAFWANGNNVGAHRVSYMLTVGPIPAGMYVCHSCDNPKCCNPRHLWLGTIDDNFADMRAKGRQARGMRQGMHTRPESRPIGERYGCAKLTEMLVREILSDTRSHRKIAADYGVSQVHISRIKRRESWKHEQECAPPKGYG